jgi:hypothetical protein
MEKNKEKNMIPDANAQAEVIWKYSRLSNAKLPSSF